MILSITAYGGRDKYLTQFFIHWKSPDRNLGMRRYIFLCLKRCNSLAGVFLYGHDSHAGPLDRVVLEY
jgi:hypothetical protein